MFTVGYINQLVILLLMTGVLILVIDMRIYKREKMKKERKVSLALGYFNLIVGCALFIGNWVYLTWFF